MGIRVRLILDWTFLRASQPGAWHDAQEFITYAQRVLCDDFARFAPKLGVHRVDRNLITLLTLTWDIDLDDVYGLWHEPQDHFAHAQRVLVDRMSDHALACEMRDDQVLRHVDRTTLYDMGNPNQFEVWTEDHRALRHAYLMSLAATDVLGVSAHGRPTHDEKSAALPAPGVLDLIEMPTTPEESPKDAELSSMARRSA